MGFYRYLENADVHVLDCSGRVDLDVGLERLRALQLEFAARPPCGSVRKLLIDFRHTVWENEDVHRQLSIATRRDFGLNAENTSLRAAILHPLRSGAVAENECWFLHEAEALEWLQQS